MRDIIDQMMKSGLEGTLLADHPLRDITWFRVGGHADLFFLPKDEKDLRRFLFCLPADIPRMVIGVGSNILVRDGGVRGCVIRLGAGFSKISTADLRVTAGAGALDAAVSKSAARAGIAGLEFLRGIPGSIGGAVKMNAGAYGGEVRDRLVQVTVLDQSGRRHIIGKDDLGLSYRRSALPPDTIITEAVFEGEAGKISGIEARMAAIMAQREDSQPVRSRTGGSTFKNPDSAQAGGRGAWELIEAAGGRGRKLGGAQMSEQHCNFMINRANATAAELEALGESIRADVLSREGIALEWEIKIIGEPG